MIKKKNANNLWQSFLNENRGNGALSYKFHEEVTEELLSLGEIEYFLG